MSVLETFAILFESNSEDATRDMDDVSRSARNLEGSLNGSSDAAQQQANSLTDMASKAAAAIGITSMLARALGSVFDETKRIDNLGKFSQTLGFDVVEVQAWGEAVKRSGGSIDSFKGSVSSLNSILADFLITGGGANAELFARIGINAFDASGKLKSAFDLLPDIADAFQGMSKMESVAFGSALGLDQGTILLLQDGSEAALELVERQRALGVATLEQAEASAAFQDQLADTSQAMNGLTRDVGFMALPIITKFFRAVRRGVSWMKQNKSFVVGFAAALAGIAAVSAAPIVLFAAKITALGVVVGGIIDDIDNWRRGNDSLTGELLAKYPDIERFFKFYAKNIKDLIVIIDELGSKIFDIQVSSERGFEIKVKADLQEDLFSFFDDTLKKVQLFRIELMELILSPLSGMFDSIEDAIPQWLKDMLGIKEKIDVNIAHKKEPDIFDSRQDVPVVDDDNSSDLLMQIDKGQGIDESGRPISDSTTSINNVDQIDRSNIRTINNQISNVTNINKMIRERTREIELAARSNIEVASANPFSTVTSNAIQNNNSSESTNSTTNNISIDLSVSASSNDVDSIAAATQDAIKNAIDSAQGQLLNSEVV